MTDGYGSPDWVQPSNTPAPVVSESNVSPSVTAGAANTGGQNGQGASRQKSGCVLSLLSILNIGLAAMMTALGVMTILHVHNLGKPASSSSSSSAGYDGDDAAATDDGGSGSSGSSGGSSDSFAYSEPFLAVYMILFAVLLFLFEFMYWSPIESLHVIIRKNFGFLYGLRGKGFFLIFVGFLCFGLGRDSSVVLLNYFTGICWFLGGCLHVFVYCTKPDVAADYAPVYNASGKAFGNAPRDENVV